MKLKYIGPFPSIEIGATGQIVERGKTVEVEDDTLAKSLLKQDDWEKADSKKDKE